MLLTYSHEDFPRMILNGIKIHTIREDKTNRWKAGRTIHHWKGNPRNTTKHPFHFLTNKCISVQRIEIYGYNNALINVRIDGRNLNQKEIDMLAVNDGLLNEKTFASWFIQNTKLGFNGNIIHWTELRY